MIRCNGRREVATGFQLSADSVSSEIGMGKSQTTGRSCRRNGLRVNSRFTAGCMPWPENGAAGACRTECMAPGCPAVRLKYTAIAALCSGRSFCMVSHVPQHGGRGNKPHVVRQRDSLRRASSGEQLAKKSRQRDDKPGSVVGVHLSGILITQYLVQPTRR